MENPLKLLARKIALHKHESHVPTSIMPLSEIRYVTIFLDTTDADVEQIRKDAKEFFSKYDAKLRLVHPEKWDINWYGRRKETRSVVAGMEDDFQEDLFINLSAEPEFAGEYEARCSKARFKIGRLPLKGEVYDIVITNPENQLPRSPVAFSVIKDYLIMIK